ncbi:uncharacterized protein [Montipora capricornis]|uniref:uncharacterized protein n=1 Tax=Montipora capricornis TaxID=246305 RepID=UPI0035F1C5A8
MLLLFETLFASALLFSFGCNAFLQKDTSCDSRVFALKPDHTLQNHVIVTSLVHDEFECQLSCLSNDTCESFNVLPNKPSHNRICELNNATRHDKPKDLKWKKGSSHYSPVQGSCVTSLSDSEMQANNGKCHPDYKGKKCLTPKLGRYSYLPAHSCKHIRDSGDSRGGGEYWIDPEKTGKPMKVFCDMTTNEANLGRYSHLPAHSCKHIRDSGDSREDGEYWIDPEKSGKPMKVFCDMTTNEGGWLLVFNAVVEDSKSLPTIAAQDSYRKIDTFRSNALFLTNNALNELRKFVAFTQMRFHCHKPGKRTFHVATIINSTGEAVIQFFTGQTIQMPTSCGSFIPLPDDNSILAGECAKWGKENENFYVGKWSHQGYKELRTILAFIKNKAHWLILTTRWECDDYVWPSNPAPPAGSFWKIYVR